MRVLAGDIGGTNTRLAAFNVISGKLETLMENSYASSQFDSLEIIIEQFLGTSLAQCEIAVLGVAGPVKNNRCSITNLSWDINAEIIARRFDIKHVILLNDLEANAWGINALDKDAFYILNPGNPTASGNASIIAAGTGLGEAGLFWDGKQHIPFASEGGHCDFAPSTELQFELLNFLKHQHGHVSWERIVSGMGLLNIYQFLLSQQKDSEPIWLRDKVQNDDKAAAISKAALDNRCQICVDALDLLVHLYGVETGNLALKLMATGGIYIGGGIAPKILPKLKTGLFLNGFLDKGRMKPLMQSMPVRVILDDRAALYGPAVFANQHFAN
ncbi:MAG: glucokinase [Methylococcales bacterium]